MARARARAKVADRVAALTTLSSAPLREQWQTVFGTPCPRLPDPLLRSAIAYRLQEQAVGALPAMVRRELARLGNAVTPVAAKPTPAVIHPGTRLVRSWHGRTVEVLAVEQGFLFEGRSYPSLTSIAQEVTGAGWSGPRFFGLTSRAGQR